MGLQRFCCEPSRENHCITQKPGYFTDRFGAKNVKPYLFRASRFSFFSALFSFKFFVGAFLFFSFAGDFSFDMTS